jgi:hypothetical protein
MKQLTIGLTGWSGTGKDTVADLLATHAGFRKLAFADAVKGEAAEAFRVDPIYFTRQHSKHVPMEALMMARAPLGFIGAVALTVGNEGRDASGHLTLEWQQQPRTPRQIMQWWGTEYRRRQSPRYWASIVAQRITEYRRAGEHRFVVTDCRFENEVDVIRALGGCLWQITRPGIDGVNTPEGSHVSATDGAAFKPETVIANAHDIRHLQQLVLSEFVALETGLDSAKVSVLL